MLTRPLARGMGVELGASRIREFPGSPSTSRSAAPPRGNSPLPRAPCHRGRFPPPRDRPARAAGLPDRRARAAGLHLARTTRARARKVSSESRRGELVKAHDRPYCEQCGAATRDSLRVGSCIGATRFRMRTRRAPRNRESAYLCTDTIVPSPASGPLITPCHPSGTGGSVHKKTRCASTGAN